MLDELAGHACAATSYATSCSCPNCTLTWPCQCAGERLTRGWVPLLRLLAAVPERGGTDAIKLGFQSVELMCSDYMSSLPVEQLRRCLEVAAMYANQQVPVIDASLLCPGDDSTVISSKSLLRRMFPKKSQLHCP